MTKKFSVARITLLVLALIISFGLLSCSVFNFVQKIIPVAPPVPAPTADIGDQPDKVGGLENSNEPENAGEVEVLDYLYTQDFSSSYSEWNVEPYQGERMKVLYEIDDGAYVWNMDAAKDGSLKELPDPPVELPQGDFLATVSIRFTSQEDSMAAGVLFRYQDNDNYYVALLSLDGTLRVYRCENDESDLLWETQVADKLVPGEFNRLIIIQKDGQYEIQVNDIPVIAFIDDTFQGGMLGLEAELDGGVQAAFGFDDIRLMQPGSSAAVDEDYPQVLPTMVDLGGAIATYDGDYNGIQYEMDMSMSFIHSTAGGWQQFCLEGSEELCVSIQPQEGSWNDAQAMADEVITGFSSTVGDYMELSRKSTSTDEGLPAYWLEYTYHWQDRDLKGMRMFVVAQNVGFDITADGEPAMMEVYQSVVEQMMKSFRLPEN